jgi:YbbR domain-containing protein
MDSNSGIYKVTSRNLISRITDQLKDEIKISNINPEILTIVLDSLITKTVPVELDINLEFEPRFNLKSPVSTTPDEVEITGPAILLDKISVLKTKVNIINKLQASVSQEIELIHPDKTTISPEKVNLFIDVEEYTEKEIRIPIEILNKPEKARITLFPSELKVVFNVGLSRFENIKPSDFRASIDCDSIVKDLNNLTINLYKKPDFIQNLRFVPEKVEFLIETN